MCVRCAVLLLPALKLLHAIVHTMCIGGEPFKVRIEQHLVSGMVLTDTVWSVMIHTVHVDCSVKVRVQRSPASQRLNQRMGWIRMCLCNPLLPW